MDFHRFVETRSTLGISSRPAVSDCNQQFVQAITARLLASTDHKRPIPKPKQMTESVLSSSYFVPQDGQLEVLVENVKKYWRFWSNFTLSNALLLYQVHIVIPSSMRQQTLAKIHHGHQGIQ